MYSINQFQMRTRGKEVKKSKKIVDIIKGSPQRTGGRGKAITIIISGDWHWRRRKEEVKFVAANAESSNRTASEGKWYSSTITDDEGGRTR